MRGAILTRVAASHIRVGTFQYLAARQDEPNLRALADYAIDRHYPELVDAPRKYLEFFHKVMDRQASLIAQWQLVVRYPELLGPWFLICVTTPCCLASKRMRERLLDIDMLAELHRGYGDRCLHVVRR